MKRKNILLIVVTVPVLIIAALHVLSGLVPRLNANLEGLGNSELAKVLGSQWMQSESVLKERIANNISRHMTAYGCSDVRCVEDFGFDECAMKNNSIVCSYKGSLAINHPKEAIGEPRQETLVIRLQVKVLGQHVSVMSLNRTGVSMRFN